MSDPIYLDYNATTPVDAEVLAAMLPYFTEHYGNPSSKRHRFGWAADEGVTVAREQLASLLGASPDEIVFTGGSTEALNLALKGLAESRRAQGRHIITVATEHKAVLASCKSLQRSGWDLTILPVGASGALEIEALRGALRSDTVLVAVMWANNETGVLNPVPEIAALLADHPAAFVCDATQAVGKVPVSVDGIDLLATSAHKFYGPKGVGALYIAPRTRLKPLVEGGSQERGLRGGTLNVPGIVGMGAAAAICSRQLQADLQRMGTLRDALETGLLAGIPNARFNGSAAERLPNTCNVTLPGIPSDRLLPAIPEIAVSTGSACSTGSGAPSHVMSAMGFSKEDAGCTLRISLGRATSDEEIRRTVEQIVSAAVEVRTPKALSPA